MEYFTKNTMSLIQHIQEYNISNQIGWEKWDSVAQVLRTVDGARDFEIDERGRFFLRFMITSNGKWVNPYSWRCARFAGMAGKDELSLRDIKIWITWPDKSPDGAGQISAYGLTREQYVDLIQDEIDSIVLWQLAMKRDNLHNKRLGKDRKHTRSELSYNTAMKSRALELLKQTLNFDCASN